MRRFRLLAGLLPLLAVTACFTPPPVVDDVGSAEAFSRTGRFALRVEEVNEKPEAIQGGFAWRDDGTRLVLDLANPVGSTLARLESTPLGARLTHADGRVEQAEDMEALLESVLGGPIPVAVLRAWIQGRLAQGETATNVERDADGKLASFQQYGWDVRLWRYDDQGPQRINLKRRDGLRDIDLRLVGNPA